MFGKILIANRGEIACRIARTARRLGVRTVAVYSDADGHALHVEMCDEAWRIGPAPARESYLNGAAIIETAKRAGAQAIHPGYGFLSENAEFARACEQAGLAFIGPPADAIAAMGSKSNAKAIMESAGVPVVPGYHGDDQDDARLAKEAARIGFPVLIKPTAGGGGKGMKVATTADEVRAALASARREAKSAFGDARVLLERYLTAPRHIEIQIFADAHGNVVHLFERDCSVQRRHQKVIEEAPAPAMDAARRQAIGEAAIAAARAIGYVNAGTVEFIVERDTFYFMEMNTRLQVEHPVTEMVTGRDLVEWQLRVAAGEPLPASQSNLALRGHAIEARIYAEDPSRDFLPSTGPITHWRMPETSARVRVDSGFRAGDEVSAHYDPMLAKLIVWGEDREAARVELLRALSQCEVTGVATNVGFVERLVASDAFHDARIDTGFIDSNREALLPAIAEVSPEVLLAAAVAEYRAIEQATAARASMSSDRHSPWNLTDAWWNGTDTHAIAFVFDDGTREREVSLKPFADGWLDVRGDAFRAHARVTPRGERLAVERIDAPADGPTTLVATVVRNGDVRHVFASGVRARLTRVDRLAHVDAAPERGGHLTAPMSGTIVAVLVKPGDEVQKGAPLVVLEAMKMEHSIIAPAAGRVAAVHFEVGDRVGEGADLVDVE